MLYHYNMDIYQDKKISLSITLNGLNSKFFKTFIEEEYFKNELANFTLKLYIKDIDLLIDNKSFIDFYRYLKNIKTFLCFKIQIIFNNTNLDIKNIIDKLNIIYYNLFKIDVRFNFELYIQNDIISFYNSNKSLIEKFLNKSIFIREESKVKYKYNKLFTYINKNSIITQKNIYPEKTIDYKKYKCKYSYLLLSYKNNNYYIGCQINNSFNIYKDAIPVSKCKLQNCYKKSNNCILIEKDN